MLLLLFKQKLMMAVRNHKSTEYNELINWIVSEQDVFHSGLLSLIISLYTYIQLHTLKSLIDKQTGINDQGWKKVPNCLLIY